MKPLGIKAYGSIPHLPGSRLGPGDHHCHEGQARICAQGGPGLTVWVEEKLDGSCVAVARHQGALLALGRAGYLAQTSPHRQHQLFAAWVRTNENSFSFLEEGERVVGEWLAQAHGTIYDLTGRSPFVAFDLMRGQERALRSEFIERTAPHLARPPVLTCGPCPIGYAEHYLGESGHYGAQGTAEGAVWRIEDARLRRVSFLAKYVRPGKVDGLYLDREVWNEGWRTK